MALYFGLDVSFDDTRTRKETRDKEEDVNKAKGYVTNYGTSR
jgi:hypothetical protein